MTSEGNDVVVDHLAGALLAQVADTFRYRSSWKALTMPEELKARVRAAPASTDAYFINAVLDVERPLVEDDHRVIAAILALATRLTPTARRGLLMLVLRGAPNDGHQGSLNDGHRDRAVGMSPQRWSSSACAA